MNPNAGTKIQMLKSSMRCFSYGLLGLLPVFGLLFCARGIVYFRPGSSRRKNYFGTPRDLTGSGAWFARRLA